jgi:hypothetical protein
MRWPWQRERTEPAANDAGGRPTEQVAAPPNVPPAGWAFLPPLQRTTGNVQLTADSGHFAGTLAAWGNPSFTGPMSHLVSAAAPPGIIDVDGGGSVPGSGEYAPRSSVEMTLLPPPAARIHTATHTTGNAAPLQRSASDGGTPAGAFAGADTALTAAPGAFPVLQVDAATPEPPVFPAENEASPAEEEALPVEDMPVPATAVDSSGAGSAPPSSQPVLLAGSTSDGNATYVPLPAAPSVQRAQSGTPDIPAAVRKVPPASKLGLGMPLAYSEPAGPSEPAAGPAAGLARLPVQRSAVRETPGPGPARPAKAGIEDSAPAHDDAADDGGPGAVGPTTESIDGNHANGTADLPLFDSPKIPAGTAAVAVQATTDAGMGDNSDAGANGHADQAAVGAEDGQPSLVVPALTTDQGGEEGHDPSVVGAQNHPLSTPPEETVVALLSAAGPAVSLASVDYSGPAGVPTPRTAHEGGAVGMPVVSRFGTAPDLSVPAEHIGEPEAPEAVAGESSNRPPSAVAHQISGDLPAASADTGWSGAAQNTIGNPGIGQPPITEARTPLADLPLQRTIQPKTERPATSTPTPKSIAASRVPMVFRIPAATSGASTPESLQRLTEMPVRQQVAKLSPSSVTAASGPVAQRSTHLIAANALPNHPGNFEPGAPSAAPPDLPGIDSPENFGGVASEAAMQLFVAGPAPWPAKLREPTAAVGRSIQRTLATEGAASAGGGEPRRAPVSWRPAELVPAAASLGTQTGSREVLSFQRTTTSSGAFPHPAEPHPAMLQGAGAAFGSRFAAEGDFGGSASAQSTLDGDSRSTALSLAIPPAAAGAKANSFLQRDVANSAPAPQVQAGVEGMESANGQATAGADNSSLSAASLQADADAESVAAGPAQPVQGTGGNGAGGRPSAGAPAATPEQLEELAKRLTGPLIRRIKAEMLLDRERRGLRTDVN